MNISSINSVDSQYNKPKKQAEQHKNQPSFKGISDSLVNFWQFVDNGGRALQFTVEDMCGTNIPRSYKGAVAGYKYTKKINIPALLQEAVREFLTGPTMCVMPVVILGLASRLAGKTANTHIENIKNLTYLMGNHISKDGTYNEKQFFETVTRDMLNCSTGKNIDEKTVKEMAEKIAKYKELTGCKGIDAKKSKQEAKELLSELENGFQRTVKQSVSDYKNVDFLAAKYTKGNINGEIQQGATKFKNYIGYACEFARDYEKQAAKQSGYINLNRFKNTWVGRRVLTFASMFFITGAAMSVIPKLYTKVSGNVNPNATAIYNEAKKDSSQETQKANAGEASK